MVNSVDSMPSMRLVCGVKDRCLYLSVRTRHSFPRVRQRTVLVAAVGQLRQLLSRPEAKLL